MGISNLIERCVDQVLILDQRNEVSIPHITPGAWQSLTVAIRTQDASAGSWLRMKDGSLYAQRRRSKSEVSQDITHSRDREDAGSARAVEIKNELISQHTKLR